jgi:hypothetical protein
MCFVLEASLQVARPMQLIKHPATGDRHLTAASMPGLAMSRSFRAEALQYALDYVADLTGRVSACVHAAAPQKRAGSTDVTISKRAHVR